MKRDWMTSSLNMHGVSRMTAAVLLFFWVVQGMSQDQGHTDLQEVDSMFVSANRFYQQEEYGKALTLYQQIEAADYGSWALYYNMANIYYRMNEIAPSIYYYEKALKLNPGNRDIRFNLDFAQQMSLDNIEPLPRSIGQRFLDAIVLKLTYDTWAKIGVALAFLFAFLFLMYHFSSSTGRKRFYFVSSIVCVALVSTVVFFSFRNHLYVKSNVEGIIFDKAVEVKNAPTNSSEVFFELHEGTKVWILESLDDWNKIRIADGKTGWIKAQSLKEI